MDGGDMRRHPNQATLLAWAAGELPWWRTWPVRRHVRGCWACQSSLYETENLICALSAGLPELSRVDVTRAWWRFRDASRHLDSIPPRSSVGLNPKWALVLIGTIGFACVITWPVLFLVRPVLFPVRKVPPRSSTAPPATVAPPGPGIPPSPSVRPRLPEAGMPTSPVAVGPTEAELLDAEVQTIAALHRSRFCLNTAITVRRVDSVVEVTGIVQSKVERDRLIRVLAMVATDGRMRVLLTDAASRAESDSGPVVASGTARENLPPLSVPPMAAWLRQSHAGGPRRNERDIVSLMNSMVSDAEQVSSEGWAIRRLAEHFPPSRLRRAPPETEQQLLQIVDDHTIALEDDLRRLRSSLEPSEVDQAEVGPLFSGTWQEEVVALQQQVEGVVRRALGTSTESAEDQQGPPRQGEMSALMNELGARTTACLGAAVRLRARLERARR